MADSDSQRYRVEHGVSDGRDEAPRPRSALLHVTAPWFARRPPVPLEGCPG